MNNLKADLLKLIDPSVNLTLEETNGLTYLNLEELYNDIERYDTDYVGYILTKLDMDKFERVVESSDIKLVNSLANRAVKLYREKKFDSRLKEDILARRLNRTSLFE